MAVRPHRLAIPQPADADLVHDQAVSSRLIYLNRDGTFMDAEPVTDAMQEAAQRALVYVRTVRDRPVTVSASALQRLDALKHPLPRAGLDAREVVRRLDEIGSPATVATTGGRYFGLVTGGALPATIAASWLAAAWDQNACFRRASPIAAALEDVSLRWLADLFGLPSDVAGAFVTGA